MLCKSYQAVVKSNQNIIVTVATSQMGLQKCENFRQFSVGSRLHKFMFESDNISPRRKLRAFV